MLYVVIIFLLVSVFLYCLLGGADFGAGIIELTSRGENKNQIRKIVSESMAPIWEANHMWLIITVVILFNAFPPIYSQISISLYIPLILLLFGIILRGTAFTFRHYDAIKDSSQEVYSKFFEISSLLVPFFFGLLIGALVSGRIFVNPESFFEGYIFPWLNAFSISIGIFIVSLFTFIAAVFLIGDTDEENLKKVFIKKAKIANLFTVISGGLVFLSSAVFTDVGFAKNFFSRPASVGLIAAATVLLPFLWKILEKGFTWQSRILAGAELLLILSAFYIVYFPTIVMIKDAENLTLMNSAASELTLSYLGWALILGSLIIFPALFYLIKVFKLGKN